MQHFQHLITYLEWQIYPLSLCVSPALPSLPSNSEAIEN